MTKNLPKNVLLLALLVIPLFSWGQAVELFTFQNSGVTYEFTSKPNSPSIPNAYQPSFGTISLESNTATSTNFDYILTYTPDEDFVGTDHFRISRWQMNPAPQFSTIDVTVVVTPALIRAYHDYAVTEANQTVVIDVLANDISSNGVKILQTVPAINHGTASYDSVTGLINFTPAPGFTGLAHFNYNLCNSAGDCDDGTVSITVLPGEEVTETETIKVFTKKNESQFILAPQTYTITQNPVNGVFDAGADVPDYTPEANFTGDDQIRFTNGTHELIFDIKVLDLESNTFAYDDRAFTTTSSGELAIDVFENDLSVGSSTSFCSHIEDQAEHGVATFDPNTGEFIYEPDPGFIGVDHFTYFSKSNGCLGEAEIATVYVFVSNFEPAETTFEMATPKETPIIIGYNVPTSTFNFNITSQGTLGETMFLPGVVDTEINGVTIQGNNLLIYVPNPGVTTGLDQIEITYCLADPNPDSQDCLMSKEVKVWMSILDVGSGEPVCVGDCVWAGDTNADGIVNMTDLLPIGLNMGEIGNERLNATFDYWYGQYAENWGSLFGGEVTTDIKHIDADGNSMVTAADTTAIRSFYGRVHNMVPTVMPYAPFEFIIEGPLFVEPGDLVSFKIKVGMSDAPAEDVYGFVFPFPYNPDAIDPESIRINWHDDNFMAYDSPVLFMDHNSYDGSFEAGYTRTSGLVASGYGELGTMDIVIDDLIGFRPDEEELMLTIGGGEGSAMNSKGEMQAVRVRPYELRVKLDNTEEDIKKVFAPEQLKVYPNPTTNYLSVHLNGQQEFEQVSLRTLTGQVVKHFEGLHTNHQTLSLKGLPSGIYVLSVANKDGVINRKVEILK